MRAISVVATNVEGIVERMPHLPDIDIARVLTKSSTSIRLSIYKRLLSGVEIRPETFFPFSCFSMGSMQNQDDRCLEIQGKLLACSQCDLLQYEIDLAQHNDARCARCGALLYRSTRIRLDWMIAFIAGSAVLLLVSNLFPIASLEKQGVHNTTTLAGTALSLFNEGQPLVAALILATIVLVPAFEVCAMLYILLPLRWGHILPGMSTVFRMRLAASSWSMMEVFMLGVLVTLVKLSDLATIIPGISLWAFAGLVILFSATNSSFSARDFWEWINLIRCAKSDHPDGQPA